MTDQDKECCGNCRHHKFEKANQDFVCTNTYSEYISDWTAYDDFCDEWEGRDERNTYDLG